MNLKIIILLIGLALLLTACKDENDMHHVDDMHYENYHHDASHDVSPDSNSHQTLPESINDLETQYEEL